VAAAFVSSANSLGTSHATALIKAAAAATQVEVTIVAAGVVVAAFVLSASSPGITPVTALIKEAVTATQVAVGIVAAGVAKAERASSVASQGTGQTDVPTKFKIYLSIDAVYKMPLEWGRILNLYTPARFILP